MSLKFSMIFTEKAQLVVTCHHAGNFIETHVSFRRLLREAALAAAVTHRQQRSLGVRCLSNNEREREREREREFDNKRGRSVVGVHLKTRRKKIDGISHDMLLLLPMFCHRASVSKETAALFPSSDPLDQRENYCLEHATH